MCGIAGIVLQSAIEPDAQLLAGMAGTMVHRGPDDSHLWTGVHIGLGFRRLSIVDHAGGRQPISNEDGSLTLICNGEIYNHQALRADLIARGHRFRSNSDSETVIHLYEEYGSACVQMLQGMFAFALWDSKQQQLFAARDPFGIKPLYYAADAGNFLFASEIKGILASGLLAPQLHPESLLRYLTFQYVPDPCTMFAGINKLPPAHYLTVVPGRQPRLERYWQPSFAPDSSRSLSSYADEIRSRLAASVASHSVGDTEIGSLLSSGIDSTAITALLRRQQSGSLHTFSVGFEGDNNETVIAAETARALHTNHHSMVITQHDYFSALPKAIWHLDEPVADPSAIALYYVSELASSHVKAVMSGEGADELFGGYRIYREPLALKPLANMPAYARKLIRKLAMLLPERMVGRNYLLRGTTPLEQRFLGNAKIFTEDAKAGLMHDFRHLLGNYEAPFDLAKRYYDETAGLDAVKRMQHIDLNLWLPGNILMKADKMSMAHGLELRVPFLDIALFELARQIPASYLTAKGTTKYVFRQAMQEIVPAFVLHRPKLGFPVPLRHWLAQRATAASLYEQIAASGIGAYIQLDEVSRMVQAHLEGRGDYARRIWTIYTFALWYTSFLAPAPDAAALPFWDGNQNGASAKPGSLPPVVRTALP